MDCSKRSAGAVAGLPDDPLVEILSRVPAKSVCRFKCVSKAWRDLIADHHNRKKLPQAMQGLFYTYTTPETMNQVDCFSFVDLTVRSVPLDIDPSFSFLTELPGIQILDLLDSCNGLILFKHRGHRCDELGYIVCNPTTKQWRAVPTCPCPFPLIAYTYLAFDPAASSHFHLVEFEVDSEEKLISVHAYSSEIGTWSDNQIDKHEVQGQLEGWHHHFKPSFEYFRCAFVNGILHLMVWDWNQHQHLIVAVDVQGKIRRMITAPDIANVGPWSVGCFGQSQGRLHCITEGELDVHGNSYKISIWVLQDHDTQEWVLKDTLSSLDLFGHKSYRGGVVDIHQDCNMVLFFRNDKLLAYSMDSKEVSFIATFKKQCFVMCFARYVPYFSETPALTNNH